MNAQHTQGRASLDTKGIGIDLPNHIPIDIGQHAAAAQVVWKMEDYERSPHCEETARRLVACWNACEGVETEVLESYPAPLSELRAQRDELLEALENMLKNGADYTATRDAARAAIAKVKGGAA
jgi:hypothetical protein